MVSRLFLLYAVIELAVLVALTSTIGFGWTLLLLVGTFILGVALAGSQAKRQLARLRTGGAVTDGALVALGTVLVVMPGLVTTAAGLLLLLPPTRAVARPIITAMAVRGIGRRTPLVTSTTGGYSTGGLATAATTSTGRSSTSPRWGRRRCPKSEPAPTAPSLRLGLPACAQGVDLVKTAPSLQARRPHCRLGVLPE